MIKKKCPFDLKKSVPRDNIDPYLTSSFTVTILTPMKQTKTKERLTIKDTPRPVGRPRMFESPKHLWDVFQQYRIWNDQNPIRVQDFVGKDGEEVYRIKQAPLTFEGFKVFMFEMQDNLGFDPDNYFSGKFPEYIGISTRIKEIIRQDQIKGGMAGIYNPSLTARINGLTDKVETSHRVEQALFLDEDKPKELDK